MVQRINYHLVDLILLGSSHDDKIIDRFMNNRLTTNRCNKVEHWLHLLFVFVIDGMSAGGRFAFKAYHSQLIAFAVKSKKTGQKV